MAGFNARFKLLGQAWTSTTTLPVGFVIALSDPMLLAVVGDIEQSRSVWVKWHDGRRSFISRQCGQPPQVAGS